MIAPEADLQKVFSILEKYQLLHGSVIEKKQLAIFEKKPETKPIFVPAKQIQVTMTSAADANRIEDANKALQANNIKCQITCSLLRNALPVYTQLRLLGKEGKQQLAHKKGQVLLIDVWATWCGPCQKPMQHNEDMLKKNEVEWKDKVRIVAVSVDEEEQVVQKRVNDRNWNRIHHYFLGGWKNQNPIIKDFKINGIPFICLVDMHGVVNFIGHPSSINLEKRINELINPQAQKEIPKKMLGNPKKLKEVLNTIFSLEWCESKCKMGDTICAKYEMNEQFENGKQTQSTCKVKIWGIERDKHLMDEIMGQLKLHKGVQIEQELVQYAYIPDAKDSACLLCKGALNFPYFWCPFEATPHSFICKACIDLPANEPDWKFKYHHNTVLLSAPVERVARKTLGKDLQLNAKPDMDLRSQYSCNGCEQTPQSPSIRRYICLECRIEPKVLAYDYVDCCSECMEKYLQKDIKVVNSLNVQGHTSQHAFLRILHPVKSYIEY